MKKIIPLLFLLLIVICPINVKALSLDKNNLTIKKGDSETISIYANVEEEVKEIDFTLVYTSYDVPAYFNLEAGLTDTNPNGVAHSIVFDEPVTGKIKLGTIKVNVVANPTISIGTINIHSGKALTTTDETIRLNSQTINVTIEKTTNNNTGNQGQKEETPKEEEKNTQEEKISLLDKIESEIVKIELKENVYEYTVNVKTDVEELDLKPIAKNDKYKIETTTQKISELKDNQIVITVKDGNNTEEYKIKVNVLEVEEVEIDNTEFKSTYSYKGKWVVVIVIFIIILFVGLGLTKKK